MQGRIVIAVLLTCVASLGGLTGCVGLAPSGALMVVPDGYEPQLPASPLLLITQADSGSGVGSGVLVHPRIILTAAHIIAPGTGTVVVRTPGSSSFEVARVARVVSGPHRVGGTNDWALLILQWPLQHTSALIASRLAEPEEPDPPEGATLLTAGFLIESDRDYWDRRCVIATTQVVDRPEFDPAGIIAHRHVRERANLTGVSGGPVFYRPTADAEPMLIGIHIATVRWFSLFRGWSRTLSTHRVPTEEIRRQIRMLDAEAPHTN